MPHIFTIQDSPPRMTLNATTPEDAGKLARVFNLNEEGDSITLVRGNVLGEPDPVTRIRPVIGFELAGAPNHVGRVVPITEPAASQYGGTTKEED